MGKLSLLAKWVENQMFNVLLEHFVVSPEILCLKQRMFFVLFCGVCFLFEKICNVTVDCRSCYRNGLSSLQNLFIKPEIKDGYRLQKIVLLMVKNCLLADSYKCIQNQNVSD